MLELTDEYVLFETAETRYPPPGSPRGFHPTAVSSRDLRTRTRSLLGGFFRERPDPDGGRINGAVEQWNV